MPAAYVYCIIYLSILCTSTYSARILACMFVPSYSHHLPFIPLWKQLASRGHQITLITANPLKNVSQFKNFHQIDLSGSYEVLNKYHSEYLDAGGSLYDAIEMIKIVDRVIDWQLQQPEVKELIQDGYGQFDLVISEAMNSIYLGFGERFKIPVIGISSMDAPYYLHSALGNYMHPILYPNIYMNAPPLDFFERVGSVIFNWLLWYVEMCIFRESQYKVAKKHFGEDLRDLSEIEKDIRILLLNINPVFQTIRPTGLNTIAIGGGNHIEDQILPQDLKDYVDSCKNGLIYFSLGTVVKAAFLDKKVIETVVATLARLPYQVIWKIDMEIENLPKNIKVMKWVPQQALLRHPNVKLFITQGGLHSIEEAIHYHVPIVLIPFMWDQHSNAKTAEMKGIGVRVYPNEITEEKFKNAIEEVLGNSTYKQNTIHLSGLINDFERSGIDTAAWWIEYCVRTKGAKHLRNPATDLPTYQFYFLDLIAFFAVVLISIIVLFGVCIKYTYSVLFKKRNMKRESE